MKIEILSLNFKKALNNIERLSKKNSILPILQNVLLETEKNFLKINSTDLETSIIYWILAKIKKEGKLVVPASILSSLVGLIKEDKIELIEENKNLILKTNTQNTRIQGVNPDDYPLIPTIKEESYVEISGEQLAEGIAQVINVPSFSPIRPEISGVYFFFGKNILKIVGTDSFRLAEKTIYLKEKIGKEGEFILPQSTTREVLNILSQETTNIKIYFDPKQVLFEWFNKEASHSYIHVYSRLIEGEYPNYQEIIPKKFTTQIILNKAEFLNQIKTASLFSGKINEVKIKTIPEDKKILISSQSVDIGQHQSSIIGKIKGQPIEISFNHKFLLDGLSNIQSSEVVFEMNSDSGPGVLKPLGDDSYIYVVMPIKSS